jgi:hypothetical protein
MLEGDPGGQLLLHLVHRRLQEEEPTMKKCNQCQYLVECLGSWDKHWAISPCLSCGVLFITHRFAPNFAFEFYHNKNFGTRPPEPCWRRNDGIVFVCERCKLDNQKKGVIDAEFSNFEEL